MSEQTNGDEHVDVAVTLTGAPGTPMPIAHICPQCWALTQHLTNHLAWHTDRTAKTRSNRKEQTHDEDES